jgi:3,4-dihydroxy 2-butanone 4-phosphate synthase/GTP cyclohydrolase II
MIEFNTIEQAIQAVKEGRIIIVTDDENRENEGDFICSAQLITPEKINFMLNGRGVLCVALTEERCQELHLDLMVGENTDPHKTAFTVTVDLSGHGCTTGVSAFDRSSTVKALSDPAFTHADFRRPGHINPLKARDGGVLRRAGHTEATVDLMRLAGLEPAGALIEIMDEDGTMARLPKLYEIAQKHGLVMINIKDLIEYRLQHESLVSHEVSTELPTEFGDFVLHAFKQTNTGLIHLALTKGEWKADEPVLVRVHSSCVTGDLFGSCRCDCGPQLHEAMRRIEAQGRGVLVYMNQEGRGIGLINKLLAYKLQEQGLDTVEANLKLGFKMDERDYGIGAQMLRHLGVSRMKLMTNNPKKRVGLIGYGLEITEIVPLQIKANRHNINYLKTKAEKMGHDLVLDI